MGRGLYANLWVTGNCRDGPKDGLERTELVFGLASVESKEHNGISAYHLVPLPDRLHPL